MGTAALIVEDHPLYEIVQVGGVIHYSEEFRRYLRTLSIEEHLRIVRTLEEQHRPRKVVRYKRGVRHRCGRCE